jgi:hypothetical protein
MIFTKVKTRGLNKITFAQFEEALWHISDKTGLAIETIVEHVTHGGPV